MPRQSVVIILAAWALAAALALGGCGGGGGGQARPLPLILSITPRSGPSTGGTAVTISGQNFLPATPIDNPQQDVFVWATSPASGQPYQRHFANIRFLDDHTITATTPGYPLLSQASGAQETHEVFVVSVNGANNSDPAERDTFTFVNP